LMRYLFRCLRKNNRGAALIELAIIIPFLLILVVGIIEFGWIFNGYITFTGAVREGARVAVVNGDYVKAVNDHINQLPRLNVSSILKSGGELQGDDITVTVSGSITPLTNFFPFLGSSIPLAVEATMRRQYLDEND
jgi:Flp pilus assembly protein TadG